MPQPIMERDLISGDGDEVLCKCGNQLQLRAYMPDSNVEDRFVVYAIVCERCGIKELNTYPTYIFRFEDKMEDFEELGVFFNSKRDDSIHVREYGFYYHVGLEGLEWDDLGSVGLESFLGDTEIYLYDTRRDYIIINASIANKSATFNELILGAPMSEEAIKRFKNKTDEIAIYISPSSSLLYRVWLLDKSLESKIIEVLKPGDKDSIAMNTFKNSLCK